MDVISSHQASWLWGSAVWALAEANKYLVANNASWKYDHPTCVHLPFLFGQHVVLSQSSHLASTFVAMSGAHLKWPFFQMTWPNMNAPWLLNRPGRGCCKSAPLYSYPWWPKNMKLSPEIGFIFIFYSKYRYRSRADCSNARVGSCSGANEGMTYQCLRAHIAQPNLRNLSTVYTL